MTLADYNKCVDDYSDGIYRFILKNLKNEDKARDVVQDTYEKLWQKVDDVASSKGKSYLFTTAYHTMIDLIRKEKRLVAFENDKHDFSGEVSHFTGLSQI